LPKALGEVSFRGLQKRPLNDKITFYESINLTFLRKEIIKDYPNSITNKK
jgi:hypothetical protein